MNKAELLARYRALEDDFATLIGPVKFNIDTNMKLERIRHLLALLGNPHHDFPSIHIGGTSGKGSTSTMIASILTQAGYKTGLHLSPHLQVVNERYQINNRLVATTKLAEVYESMKPAIEQVARENSLGRPTYFEVQTALAFCLFHREQVDVAVVEVGLGGTFDATNVLPAQVAVLTSIGLDHTEILGDTIELIATDKAGIIKSGQIVVSGVSQPSTQHIVAERCVTQGASLWQLGQAFTYQYEEERKIFSVSLADRNYIDLSLGMQGAFQAANAACAIAAAYAFSNGISEPALREGLKRAIVPGRMEIVQQQPTVILDGAHNPDKMQAAAQAIVANYTRQRKIVVLALKSDKAYKDILPYIVSSVDVLLVTTFTTKGLWEPIDPNILAMAAREMSSDLDVRIVSDPLQAVESALAIATRDDVVWITGSLYLIGDVREYWYPYNELLLQAEQSSA